MNQLEVEYLDVERPGLLHRLEYHGSGIGNIESLSAVFLRNFHQAYVAAKSQGLPDGHYYPLLHCGTSFGNYKEVRGYLLRSARLRETVKKILGKLGRLVDGKLLIPEEVVHYSEWLHVMRRQIAGLQQIDCSGIRAPIHPACHVYKMVPEDVVYDDTVLDGNRVAVSTGIMESLGTQVIDYSQESGGVGYCAVTRVLRMAQIARSIALFKDEKIAGRHYKQIHFVSGVSRQDIKDEMLRGQEEANNSGMIRFIMPARLASLDPEKPGSAATIDLASLLDAFNFDEDMTWYISCLALGFGVDYQEFAPLPGGNIGSSQQSMILHRKGSGKGPAVFMRMLSDAFRNYGVLPKGVEMRFNDKDEQEELERQTVRSKALEGAAISIRMDYVLTPEAVRNDLVRRGIYSEETIAGIPEKYGLAQMDRTPTRGGVGQKGGNTMVEDVNRNETGKTKETVGDRLRKELESLVERIRSMHKETVPGLPNVVFNIPEPPPPLINVLTPKLTGAEQKIQRDRFGNITDTRTELSYSGYVMTRGDEGGVPESPASVQRSPDGSIVINAPTPRRQVVNIRMPRVTAEEQAIVRDKLGNIERTSKKITYEE